MSGLAKQRVCFLAEGGRALLSRQANCFAGVHQPNALDAEPQQMLPPMAQREAEVAEKRERKESGESEGSGSAGKCSLRSNCRAT